MLGEDRRGGPWGGQANARVDACSPRRGYRFGWAHARLVYDWLSEKPRVCQNRWRENAIVRVPKSETPMAPHKNRSTDHVLQCRQ